MAGTDMEVSLLPSELLEVVRLSLKATAFGTTVADGDETFDPRNPALRRLVEAVLYSRRFILTYYAFLSVILLLFSIVRFTRAQVAQRRGKRSGLATPDSFTSSSSTLRGDASPQEQEDPERTPLLLKASSQSSDGPHGTLSRLACYARSVWMYQPGPLPAVTSPNNTLPSNRTTTIVVLMLGINVFYLLFHTEPSVPMLFGFADRAGLCFVMNLPILYLLGAKSNQPLQLLTGWSYEGLNIFHRRLGEWMIALAAMHSVGMLGVWYTLLRPLHFTLWRFISGRVGLLGLFTFVSYIAIYISSIGWIRRLFYERFLLLHVILQVAALVFLFFHHHNSRPYVLASFSVWALDRILIRNLISSQKFIATLEVASDQKTVLLHCTIPIRRNRLALRASIRNGWLPSQHVFLTVPGMGYAKHRLQAHPFTIASSAPPTDFAGSWNLQLLIRAQEGFSSELLEYAKLHQHVEVLLDGPYGSTETLKAMHEAERVCLVAGGSGIAVTYPLAWALCIDSTSDSVRSLRTVYEEGQRVKAKVSGYDKPNASKCNHIWIRQDPRSDQWLSYVPRANALTGLHNSIPFSSASKDSDRAVDLISSRFDTAGIHALRPDVPTELREWVDFDTTDALKRTQRRIHGKILVVVSGPDSLVRSVRNSAAGLARRGHNIDVNVEKFGW